MPRVSGPVSSLCELSVNWLWSFVNILLAKFARQELGRETDECVVFFSGESERRKERERERKSERKREVQRLPLGSEGKS